MVHSDRLVVACMIDGFNPHGLAVDFVPVWPYERVALLGPDLDRGRALGEPVGVRIRRLMSGASLKRPARGDHRNTMELLPKRSRTWWRTV